MGVFEYGNDRGQLIASAGMATAAAMMMPEIPVARQIALALGVLVANPGSMRDAAGQWQAPSTGDGEIDFDGIREQVAGLKARFEENELWSGPAYKAFGDSLDRLIEQLDVAKQHFQGVGNSMEFVAQLYHFAAEASWCVASAMLAIAYAYLSIKHMPYGLMPAITLAMTSLIPLAAMARGLSVKLGKTLMVTTGVVAMVNLMCASMSQTLTQNRPKPDFTPTGVEYTEPEQKDGVGGLKPTNDGMPDMGAMNNQGGGMMGLI